MTNEPAKIALMQFVDAEGCSGPRFDLSMPWVSHGFAYATDAKIGVRVAQGHWADPGEWKETEGRKPNLAEVLAGADKIEHWLPLPEFPACGACNSKGEVERSCRNCDGSGDCQCECCEKVHECGGCDGRGVIKDPCGMCDVMFGGEKVARKYANKIASLPGVQWGSLAKIESIVFFRFDGGMGAVATLKKDE